MAAVIFFFFFFLRIHEFSLAETYVSPKIASLNIPHTGLEAKNCDRYRKQSFVGETTFRGNSAAVFR